MVPACPLAAPTPPTLHWRSNGKAHGTALASVAAVAALVAGTAAWSLHGAWHGATVPPCVRSAAPAPRHAPSDDALDVLRQAALLGHADAAVLLTGALLDRYDAGAGAPALFEAMQWLQRELDTPAMLESGLVQRVAMGACRSDPLLHWHWLCEQGE